MMQLKGLHLLLTYQCLFECDHCFVWGSPRLRTTLSRQALDRILQHARSNQIETIYFEGGEPFLYYPLLVYGVGKAASMGFHVGVVTNAFWALDEGEAAEWLKPLAGKLQDLSISSDLYHADQSLSETARAALAAASSLEIPASLLSVALPNAMTDNEADISAVMYRGRAAIKLAPLAVKNNWANFDECPHEDFYNPGRCHVDPHGNVHLCQGIVIGNVLEEDLRTILARYRPADIPCVRELAAGGPAWLVRHFNLEHGEEYADACHLCYTARLQLRDRFPQILKPDEMYGALS